MKVGFIGLGAMGRHMARHLQEAGHDMTVHDIRREAATPFLESGADWADTPKGVAFASETIFTSLPGPVDVEGVVLGPDGIADGITSGQVYLDLSTNSPVVTRRLHKELAERGVEMLDAPVSGGVEGAEAGTLSMLVGGDEALYNRVLPLLQQFGDKPFYCGPSGAGQVCKLVNNYLSLSIQPLLAEAFTIGIKAGVNPATIFNAVSRSTGDTPSMQRRYPTGLFKGNFAPGFTVNLGRKDLSLALEMAKDFDVPVQFGPISWKEYDETSKRNRGLLDIGAVALIQEERSGVEIRADLDVK
jgi:3-hydroxyisobutyrate dehydrogenase-like beta-hydroxyacid dehydrogenase